MNKYLKKLYELYNFGIKNGEELSPSERSIRISEFKENLSYENYSDLFNDITNYLLDENVVSEEKSEIINMLLEVIKYFPKFSNDIKKFPSLINELYAINEKLFYMFFEFGNLETIEICSPVVFEKTTLNYINFLEDPVNEFYVHNYYGKIENYNNRLLKYLDRIDYDGKEFKTLINPEVIEILKTKINVLSRER